MSWAMGNWKEARKIVLSDAWPQTVSTLPHNLM